MDEFTGLAIWILMIFLAINASIIWFDSSTTFQSAGFTTGTSEEDIFNETDINSVKNEFNGTDCATATPTDPAYAPCLINSLTNIIGSTITLPGKIISTLWDLLTRWVRLLETILQPVPGGQLFINILVPFFGLIEFIAIFVIVMRVAGIIRGGS